MSELTCTPYAPAGTPLRETSKTAPGSTTTESAPGRARAPSGPIIDIDAVAGSLPGLTRRTAGTSEESGASAAASRVLSP